MLIVQTPLKAGIKICFDYESVLVKVYQPLCFHFAQFSRKGTPVKIQIISHLLPVKRNAEFGTAVLQDLCAQKRRDSVPDAP